MTRGYVKHNRSHYEKLMSLTDREVEIAWLLVQGKTNREIAALLTLSTETVKTHVSNILSKLWLTSRHEVTAAHLT